LPNRVSIRRSAYGAPGVPDGGESESKEFLGQRDDDARRASHVAEPVLVFVLNHCADEFGAVGARAGHGVVDSSTANMIWRRPSVFVGAIAGSAATSCGLRNFVSSTRPWPSGVRIIAMSA
jgi:hypothetical protein